ncbi:DsbA family protein [Nocardia sp. NPDC059239]|uniref:DsbA family oxidoreductase n=1 Tax=Nocardia sp. NPDC059239 TaxID=3346785 RepID=UPI0036AFB532
MTAIVVYEDYVCPYCLLAHDIIESAVRDAAPGGEVGIQWRPYELRPAPVPTLRVEDDYLPRVWRRSVYPLAERLGVRIVLPGISPQPRSTLAFEGAVLAQRQGVLREYNDRVFRAFFQEERDIGDIDVLTDVAGAVGIESEPFRHALDTLLLEPDHRDRLRDAERDRVTAVPTVIAGSYRTSGVPDPAALRNAVARLAGGTDEPPDLTGGAPGPRPGTSTASEI